MYRQEEEKDIEISDELARTIVQAMLTVPLPYSQVCVPGLEKYSQGELRNMFGRLLHDPTRTIPFEPPSYKPPWNNEEDFILLVYLSSSTETVIDDFVREYGETLSPCRSREDIEQRLHELSMMSAEERDEILETFSRKTVLEQRFYESVTAKDRLTIDRSHLRGPQIEQCECIQNEYPDYPVTDEANREIEKLEALVPMMTEELFQANDLAVLMGTNVSYTMRKQMIIIGRGTQDTPVDVDISYLADHICPHVSRHQAVLQFMMDGNFYIENVGNSIFRVSGKIIKPGQYARVDANALLDFADNVLVFVPNGKLIKEITQKLDDHMKHIEERI